MIKTPLSTMIGGAFWTPCATIIGSTSSIFNTIIKALFANNEQGFAYDPNDLSTLYQDAAGTIPVTAAGQPVSLMLDKSKGLVLGSENVINGSLTTLTSWEAHVTAPASVTLVAGGVRVYSPAGEAATLRQQLVLKRGGWYKVQFNVKSITGSGYIALYAGVSGLQRYDFSTSGVKTIYLQAAPTGDYLLISRSTICDFVISDVSVKEVAGNHAYQGVSASRPILRQTPILGSELVVNGTFNTGVTDWSTGNGSAITKVTNGGMLITATTAANSQAAQNMDIAAGKTVQASVTFKNKVGNAQPKIALWSSSTGDVGGAIASSTTVSGTLTFLAKVPVGFAGKVIVQTNNANIGDNIEISSVSVKEVTGYRTDQNYLEFDGVDDFLQTNNIDFTMTDKVSLFAGVRKLSDANRAVLVELGTNGVNSFLMQAPTVAGEGNFAFTSGASFLKSDSVGSMVAPISAVLTAKADIQSSYVTLIANGGINTPVISNQGIGNYQNAPLYIGRRGGTSLPFNGHLYSLIGIGRLTSDSETIALEKSIAKNTGVTLSV